MTTKHSLATAGLTLLLAATLPHSASAHITLDTREAPAGGTVRLAIRVPHGCDGAATTGLRVQAPEGVALKPQPKAGWMLTMTTDEARAAAAPAPTGEHAGHAMHVAAAPTEIAWRGGTLPDAYYDEFIVQARMPDAPGRTVYFPFIQECEGGKTVSWTEQPAADQTYASLHAPAFPVKLMPRPISTTAVLPIVVPTTAGSGAPVANRTVAETSGSLTVTGAFSRAMPGSGPNVGPGVAYFTITGGDKADRLVSVTSPRAPKVEMHTMSMQGDVMRMREVEGIDIPAHGVVKLAPGGLHLMIVGLSAPLRTGETLPLTLTFAQAGTRTVQVPVGGLGATGPAYPLPVDAPPPAGATTKP